MQRYVTIDRLERHLLELGCTPEQVERHVKPLRAQRTNNGSVPREKLRDGGSDADPTQHSGATRNNLQRPHSRKESPALNTKGRAMQP